MNKLTREDLYSLEEYADKRPEFRQRVLAHKKHRQIMIGDHATLYFEDRLTIQYQVQEMLRIEKIFERDGIEEELDAYNPLIPDGTNLKATFMIEYADIEERREALTRMSGIEHRIWVQVGEHERVFAVANEDLDRSTDDKASAVHFLRFELGQDAVAAFKSGTTISFGIDHPQLAQSVTLTAEQVESLAGDLD